MEEARVAIAVEDLVSQAKRGDVASFQMLFERFYMDVYRHAFCLVGYAEDAEDVTQEVFVKVARNLQDFRGESSFRTWLWRIVTHTAFDCNKKKKRQKNKLEHMKRESVPFSEEHPSPAADREMSQKVLAALDRLPLKQRQAVILTYLEDRSHEEAAKICGCTLNTLSWRVFMAKRRLQKYLKGVSRP